jgi:hypothetical protein
MSGVGRFRQAAAEHVPAAGGGEKENRGNCGWERERGQAPFEGA